MGSDVFALDQDPRALFGLAQQFGGAVETRAELFVLGEDGLASALVDFIHGRVLHLDHPARTIDLALVRIFCAQAVLDVVVLVGEVIGGMERDAVRCILLRLGRCGLRWRSLRRRLLRGRNGLNTFFRDTDTVHLRIPVLHERLCHVLVRHALERRRIHARQRLQFFLADIVEDVGARALKPERSCGDRGLKGAVTASALLMGHVHVQAIRRRFARQIRPAIAFMPVNQARPVIQVQPRCCIGIDHCIQLASSDTVLLGGRGRELK